jgi:hypothetical protein
MPKLSRIELESLCTRLKPKFSDNSLTEEERTWAKLRGVSEQHFQTEKLLERLGFGSLHQPPKEDKRDLI